MMPEVVCLGELLIDFVSTTVDTEVGQCPAFAKAPGGAPANVAAGLAKLGVSSGFIGKVGADSFGDFLRDTMQAAGVDTSFLLADPEARTTLAFVATRGDGRKEILFYRNPGADIRLRQDELSGEYIESARVFHYGSVSLSHSPSREATLCAIETAKAAGAMMSYDPNLRLSLWDSAEECSDWIWKVMPSADVAKLAEEEWEFITGATGFEEGSRRLLDTGVALVIMTSGEKGCRFTTGRVSGELPAHAVSVVDPLGAGDGFVAGMISQLMRVSALSELDELTIRNALQYASAVGALTTQKVGVIPALPTAEEVARFLGNHREVASNGTTT